MIEKEVEKLLRSGNNTAVLKVYAEVCLCCGERLYSKETVRNLKKSELNSSIKRRQDFNH